MGRSRRQRHALAAIAGELVAVLGDGIAIHDDGGQLVLWNEAAARISGWSAEQAAGRFRPDLPAGLVDLGPGRWVELQRWPIARGRRVWTVTVFSDAHTRMALREAYAQLDDLATSDAVTGLPNRRLAEDRLRLSLSVAGRDHRSVAVLAIDLDRFKLVNDSLGHALGDELLRQVAARLRTSVGESDTVARLGDDEFLVILHDLGPASAEEVAAAVQRGMERRFVLGGHEVWLSCSIGIAVHPFHGEDAPTLIQHADLAMDQAKQRGGNAWAAYEPLLAQTTRDRLTLAGDLRRALAGGELELYYQPQIDMDTGEVAGLEALIRWNHPERGQLLPGRFLPISDDEGTIVDVDRWVVHEACAQARRWLDEGVDLPTVAVNLSARSLTDGDPQAMVEAALSASGLPPERLEVEVSEHVVASTADAEKHLAALRNLGVQVAIDDFGTGYSSLAHLKRFPLDTIKLDRSFVVDIAGQPSRTDIAILRAVVTMAADLGLRCVAEGVETPDQRRLLRYLQCHLVQGHLYSPALPATAIPRVIRHRQLLSHA